MRDIEREMAMDLQHDEAIERGKACANCKHCTVSKLPHNWWKPMFYCDIKHEFQSRYAYCEKWEET